MSNKYAYKLVKNSKIKSFPQLSTMCENVPQWLKYKRCTDVNE